MNLTRLKEIFVDHGCQKIFVKKLSANDNSKNQVYLGGSFDILNDFPISEIITDSSGDWKKDRFKATVNFSWIGDDGNLYSAPSSQLILYPKYPEVRFSGFLLRCETPPSELMTQRLAGRVLLLGVTRERKLIGYVDAPESEIAHQIETEGTLEYGVFLLITLPTGTNNKERLLNELRRIHNLEWINSKRLDGHGNLLPCVSSNCGGYTLEAELGIRPNGFSEPDYLGWEVKQFAVRNFESINSAIITLMTPEPTDGYYTTAGAEAFIRKYGYNDLGGIADRMNFGGIHKSGRRHPRTTLQLELVGFDIVSGKIRETSGRIALIDTEGNEAASWSFASLILHWNRKHNQACYVPSMSETSLRRQYKYGYKVILGEATDFQFFLRQMSLGNIVYDPGIKMENASHHPKIKKRSQFRIKSVYLSQLYRHNEVLNILD